MVGWGKKVVKVMNIIDIPFIVEAKTMSNLKTKNVSYYFSESTHSLCLDKKTIMLGQVNSYERLLDISKDQRDMRLLKKKLQN